MKSPVTMQLAVIGQEILNGLGQLCYFLPFSGGSESETSILKKDGTSGDGNVSTFVSALFAVKSRTLSQNAHLVTVT